MVFYRVLFLKCPLSVFLMKVSRIWKKVFPENSGPGVNQVLISLLFETMTEARKSFAHVGQKWNLKYSCACD